MKIIEKNIDFHGSDSIKIYVIGDLHVGSAGFDEYKFKRDIKEIENNEKAYWVGVGDYADSIVIQDAKRFDHKSLDERFIPFLDDLPQQQCKMIVDLLKPIASKCLGCVSGNHENTIRSKHSFDMLSYICDGLGVDNLGDVAVIILRMSRTTNSEDGKRPSKIYRLYVSHGTMVGNAIRNKMRKIMSDIYCDLYFFGHGHQRVVEPRVAMSIIQKDNSWDFKDHQQLSIMCGSYLKLYVQDKRGYGERAAFSPNKLGMVHVEIFPRASEERFKDEFIAHV